MKNYSVNEFPKTDFSGLWFVITLHRGNFLFVWYLSYAFISWIISHISGVDYTVWRLLNSPLFVALLAFIPVFAASYFTAIIWKKRREREAAQEELEPNTNKEEREFVDSFYALEGEPLEKYKSLLNKSKPKKSV